MPQISREKIGEYIKSKREELGIRQESLAYTINVAPSTLSLYESGKRTPELETLNKISKALSVNLAEIIGVDIPDDQLNISLRAQGLSNEEMNAVKSYIDFLRFKKENEAE